MNAPYLRITIFDNDYVSCCWWILGRTLLDIFESERYPKESDLNNLKPVIANLWCSIYNISYRCRWEEDHILDLTALLEYFNKNLHIEIVDYLDVENFDGNHENIFIPLFEGNDKTILLR